MHFFLGDPKIHQGSEALKKLTFQLAFLKMYRKKLLGEFANISKIRWVGGNPDPSIAACCCGFILETFLVLFLEIITALC